MANIRVPKSAEPLLPYCRPWNSAREDASFGSYAEMVVFAAALGFKTSGGHQKKGSLQFLTHPNPIGLTVFKNMHLFPIILLISLATAKSPSIAKDEEKMAHLIESYADQGCKELTRMLKESTPSDFIFTLARMVAESGQTFTAN